MLSAWRQICCVWCVVCINALAQPSIKQYDKFQQSVFEFLADDMEYHEDEVIGRGNVIIINLDYYIRAKQANYNLQTKEITLEGDVNAYRGNALYLKAEHVRIKLQEDSSFLEPFYLQESQSGMWISAKQAQVDSRYYETKEAVVSTCSFQNPIWKLKASQSRYDKEKGWLSLWNPTFCLYDVPLVYLPYISFSLGFERKSGLLYPLVGHSNDDGFIYEQPIFFAPYAQWDMTLFPQIRTQRGYGLFNEFRLIDDKDQILWMNFGAFVDKNSYKRFYNLENKTHFGAQLEYQRKDLLSKKQNYFNEDGLYVDIAQINDIDYFRLQKDSAVDRSDLQGSLLTSRLNYFLKSEQDYLGLYGRYYNDLEQTSNVSTLQTLPHFQYHRQIDSLFSHVYYTFDYQAKNYTRPQGYRALQQEVTLPIFYSQAFLDDYLNLTISPVFYATSVDYSNLSQGLKLSNGRFYNHFYSLKLNSDLMRPYARFDHTISGELEYVLPAARNRNGDFTTFFALPGDREYANGKFSQYFYRPDQSLLFSHQIEQRMYVDHKKGGRFGEIENAMEYFYNQNLSALSGIFYSHQSGKITEAIHQLSYKQDSFNMRFGHFFRSTMAQEDLARGRFGGANYFNASLDKEFDYFTVHGGLGYDYKERYFKTWQIRVESMVRCFSIGLKYASEVYPTLTTSGAKAKTDRYVLLQIKFIPLFSSNLKIGN